jgi:hypothetical protein
MTTKSRLLSAYALAFAMALSACTQNVGVPRSTQNSGGNGGQPAQPAFSQFQDIPVPGGASMNMDRTLVFGAQESWIGRLVLTASFNTANMFDFYKARTPEFGWQEITTVRSATSVMTYTRGERVMTIQIKARTITGTEVDITVSPRRSQNDINLPASGGQRITPAPISPVRRGR